MTDILLTGATGTLAKYLLEPLSMRGTVVGLSRSATHPSAVSCDLCDAVSVATMLEQIRPDIVVHLAALTDVDACERKPVDAFESNVRATANLVSWLAKEAPQTRFVYVSTDQIYDAPGPSTENTVRPSNVYGLTKLWGEDHASRLTNALMLRVNFFSGPDAGLVRWLLNGCRKGETMHLFSDVLFNPLHAQHLADCMCHLIDKQAVGTLNLGASGAGLTKAAFLRAAARALGLSEQHLQDGSVADLSLPAYRPRDMRMSVEQAEKVLGQGLPTVEDGLSLLAQDRSWAAD